MSWEIVYALGALVLGLAIAWGIMQYRARNKANDPLTEAATREEYDHPDRYAAEQQAFRAQIKR